MPEADRFEQRLPPQWKRAYRVAKTGNGDVGVIVDCLTPAVRETLQQHAKPEAFIFACELLQVAVNAPNDAQLPLVDWGRQVAEFYAALDNLENVREDELCAPLLARAAKRAHARLVEKRAPVSHDDVRDALAVAFGEELVNQQWAARVRSGLMEATHRDLDNQEAWERTLHDALGPQVCALIRTLCSKKRVPRRSPPRLTKQMDTTLATLLAPIDLSGADK
jgi:hypothetical protein